MVRINLINVACLADQHLVAEYNEILMLLGYVRKHPAREDIPEEYSLGKGHIKFFKDKLLYLQERHELLKDEMRKRGFKPEKSVSLEEFPGELKNNFFPQQKDIVVIKERLTEKIKMKPEYYRYYGVLRKPSFFLGLLRKG